MASKQFIQTQTASATMSTYSQAVKVGKLVYLLGQIGLDTGRATVGVASLPKGALVEAGAVMELD
jgi:enamine deaminase RidA (YjgF/YER057c/UK114 family)